MEWIKIHFEKVILGVLALTLLVSTIFLYLDSRTFLEIFSHRNATQSRNNAIPPFPIEEIRQSSASDEKPASWVLHEGSLFVSRPYILREGQLIDLMNSAEMVHPPIPNGWLVKYGLDYSDPNLLNTDPNHTGFTVLEDWMAGADPTDPKSIPPYYIKLRLKQYIRIPFLLKFNGTPDDGETFAINMLSRHKPTQFLKIGEMIEGTPFKLISYQSKKDERDGIPLDNSELVLENTSNGEKVTLVNGKVVDSPTSKAKFVYLLDHSEFDVKKGDAFVLPSEKNVQYKLIDITDTQAVIQNVQTGSQHTIPPLQTH